MLAQKAERKGQEEVAKGDGSKDKYPGIPLVIQLFATKCEFKDTNLTYKCRVLDETDREGDCRRDYYRPRLWQYDPQVGLQS